MSQSTGGAFKRIAVRPAPRDGNAARQIKALRRFERTVLPILGQLQPLPPETEALSGLNIGQNPLSLAAMVHANWSRLTDVLSGGATAATDCSVDHREETLYGEPLMLGEPLVIEKAGNPVATLSVKVAPSYRPEPPTRGFVLSPISGGETSILVHTTPPGEDPRTFGPQSGDLEDDWRGGPLTLELHDHSGEDWLTRMHAPVLDPDADPTDLANLILAAGLLGFVSDGHKYREYDGHEVLIPPTDLGDASASRSINRRSG